MSSTPPAPHILVLNGPNLNLLGLREPEIYGRTTHAELVARIEASARRLGLGVSVRQSNHEGQLIDWIHEARTTAAAIVINPGAYSHSSIAIMDALAGVALPVIEVHLSNVHRRESFRHHSYVSHVAEGVIAGLGPVGYELALIALAQRFGGRAVAPAASGLGETA